MSDADLHDVILVGGGLASCVALLALAAARPGARVAIVERAAALCGNHTWCLHADDVPPELVDVLAPALAHRWPGYDVAFPEHVRTLDSPYACATSASLAGAVHAAIAARPGFSARLGTAVQEVSATEVVLADGQRLRGRCVVDARGPAHFATNPAACGYQKFIGLELALTAPHGLARPMLMDATVAQRDGFRFLYVLPLAERRVLIEDTYFSDTPDLDDAESESAILAYASARGWQTVEVVREERGVLPLPLAMPEAPRALGDGPLVAGYQGGWFHPTTGYSMPLALRLAQFIAHGTEQPEAAARWQLLVDEHRRQLAFALRLNKMLFRWFAPAQRHHVLARFYRAPEDTVRRFYALRTTRGDRARILCGRPPRGMSWRAVLTGQRVA